MTYTEAAVEVLRLVGRPLHYKKIAQIAVERGLLSHVGKSPEITMSTRLATLLRKDRGDSPIVKVKPGVFGLREFSEEVLRAAAEGDASMEVDLSELPPVEAAEPEAAASEGGEQDAEPAAPGEEEPLPKPSLPGVDAFPEEEDDDEPILGRPSEAPAAAEGEGEGGEGGRRKKRRRRRKKSKDREEQEGAPAPSAAASTAPTPRDRAPRRGQPVADTLADAVEDVLQAGPRQLRSFVEVARELVQRGRLEGDPQALAPTVAATVRGDEARRRADRRRLRFRVTPQGVRLVAWDVPGDALRAEREARRFAARQRRRVREELLRRLEALPAEGFVEIVASWLCAEGVSSIRGVLPPSGIEGYHLAGQLSHAGLEARLAVVVLRGATVTRETVVGLRGSLHHYGPASMGWIVTTGQVAPEAREEAAIAGAAPIALVDGTGLAEALERAGIGVRSVHVPLAVLDAELLEALEGPRRTSRRASRKERERARAAEATEAVEPAEQVEAAEPAEAEASEPAEAEGAGRKRRRRRRRKGAEGEPTAEPVVEAAESAEQVEVSEPAAEASSSEAEQERAAEPPRAEEGERAEPAGEDEPAVAVAAGGAEPEEEGPSEPAGQEPAAEAPPAGEDGGDAS